MLFRKIAAVIEQHFLSDSNNICLFKNWWLFMMLASIQYHQAWKVCIPWDHSRREKALNQESCPVPSLSGLQLPDSSISMQGRRMQHICWCILRQHLCMSCSIPWSWSGSYWSCWGLCLPCGRYCLNISDGSSSLTLPIWYSVSLRSFLR